MAYTKLHGDYDHAPFSGACEAAEDLAVVYRALYSAKVFLIPTDSDRFWTEELLHANKDRLFGCAYGTLDSTRSGDPSATVNGSVGDHAYSVLRAVEFHGKRIVVIRNPWGKWECGLDRGLMGQRSGPLSDCPLFPLWGMRSAMMDNL